MLEDVGEKVAVVGTAPSSRGGAPFGDPSWEIWGCSPGNHDLPRISRFFEVHDLDTGVRNRGAFYEHLKNADFPVYTFEAADDLPTAEVMDPQPLLDLFGPEFMTSSVSWMLAAAVRSFQETGKPSTVGIWGVDMCADDEYAHQKPGCWFFIRLGRLIGMNFVIPAISDLHVHVPPYPRQSELAGRVQQRQAEAQHFLNETERAIQGLEMALDAKRRERAVYEGRLLELDYWAKNWSSRWSLTRKGKS